LWFFYASRASALRLAGGARLNTDANLLTEVRLGASGGAAAAEEVAGLLRNHYTLDVAGLLAQEDAVRTLTEAGSFFLGFQGRLVKLGKVSTDGTKLQGHASRHKAMSYCYMKKEVERRREEIEALVTQAFQQDESDEVTLGSRRGCVSDQPR
jgi:hypothetical protein